MEIGIPESNLKKVHEAYRKRAFSLIEVLLVLALVAILVGIVAGNAGAFIKGSNFEPPDRVLKKAVLDAVYHASESKRAAYLSYFEENATFQIIDTWVSMLKMRLSHVTEMGLISGEDNRLGCIPSIRIVTVPTTKTHIIP